MEDSGPKIFCKRAFFIENALFSFLFFRVRSLVNTVVSALHTVQCALDLRCVRAHRNCHLQICRLSRTRRAHRDELPAIPVAAPPMESNHVEAHVTPAAPS